MLMLAEPYSFPVGDFLSVCNARVPGLDVMGGMASAGTRAGAQPPRASTTASSTTGAVALLCSDDVPVRAVVSQGCRPIGTPLTVTRAERNLVHELAGSARDGAACRRSCRPRPSAERELMRNGLHLGVVVDEHKLDFARGDFLVRNVLGADRSNGAIAVGERVDVGRPCSSRCATRPRPTKTSARLLAGVHGRGRAAVHVQRAGPHLFAEPNHDAAVVEEMLGPVPLAGAFCAGEIGPIGGRNFLHSFTASVAVFER